MAFRVANRKGVIVRAASSLGSDKTGELPCGALCTVTERVTLDDTKKPRAKITADGGVVGWVTLLPKFLVPADAAAPPPRRGPSLAAVAKNVGQLALIAAVPLTAQLPAGFCVFWLSSTAFTATQGEVLRRLDAAPVRPP